MPYTTMTRVTIDERGRFPAARESGNATTHGFGAHGHFELYRSCGDITRAAFLQDPKSATPIYARFSMRSAESGDVVRDVCGFAVKFYTDDGIFDLVGSNIPVASLPSGGLSRRSGDVGTLELEHVMLRAGIGHDAFWDFVSHMPQSMHMIMWAMSDRAIPRSLRMIEGFGVNTFRFVDAVGRRRFVKFHWRPRLGARSLLTDEARKLVGADRDYHRRDLWEAIERGERPEFELGAQVFDDAFAESFAFDVFDPTKIIPEEVVPLRALGRMVLERNPTGSAASRGGHEHPGASLVPGIEVQPARASGAHELMPHQTDCAGVPARRVDHYSQARMFYRSLSEPEQRHLATAFAFELGKVASLATRRFMLGHLRIIDFGLSAAVEVMLGMQGQAAAIVPARGPIDLPQSPALSLVAKAKATLLHRIVGALATNGCDGALLEALRVALILEGARLEIIAQDDEVVTTHDGRTLPVDHVLGRGPSVLFDAVLVLASEAEAMGLLRAAAAVDWVRDAFGHLKVIGYVAAAKALLDEAGVEPDGGVIELGTREDTGRFIAAARRGRIWARELALGWGRGGR